MTPALSCYPARFVPASNVAPQLKAPFGNGLNRKQQLQQRGNKTRSARRFLPLARSQAGRAE